MNYMMKMMADKTTNTHDQCEGTPILTADVDDAI